MMLYVVKIRHYNKNMCIPVTKIVNIVTCTKLFVYLETILAWINMDILTIFKN